MGIIIRPITPEDTRNVVKWRNNPLVKQNFIYQVELTEQSHMEWFKTQIETGKVAQFIIHDEEANCDVGSVYLRDIDQHHKKAEFGIFIGEDSARGKGFGTSATKLILEYAFEQLKLNRVFLRVFAENTGAIKSYEKAGFVKEGLFRQDVIIGNKPVDMVFMAILKEQWDVR